MTRHIVGGTDVTDHVRALVDAAPPLSAEQRERLRGLLRPVTLKSATPPPRRAAA